MMTMKDKYKKTVPEERCRQCDRGIEDHYLGNRR